MVVSVVGPAGDTEELSVCLGKADVRLAVTNGDPGVGCIGSWCPGILMEERSVAVSRNIVLEFVDVGKSATLGCSKRSSSVPAVGAGDSDPEDVAHDSKVSSVGVVRVILGPGGDTKELGVRVSEALVRLAVTN